MNELPDGWIKTSLGEIASWGSGGTPSRNEETFYRGTIPWVKSGELNTRYVKESEEYITEAAIRGSSAKIFPAGSVAIAMYGATIGKTAILAVDAATNQACAVGVPSEGLVSAEFLHRLLQNEKDAFIEKGKGGAQPNISQTVIKTHEIYIPPLAEQTRIIQKLDELLAQVDTLKKRIDAIPLLLKRFRQSVLSEAISGRLTIDWRAKSSPSNTQPTDIDWNKLSIEKISNPEKYSLAIGPFGSNLKVSDYKEMGRPLVFVREIRAEAFGDEKTKFITQKKFEELRAHHIQGGDILITKMGDPPGDIAIYPENASEAVITADCIKFRVNELIIIRKFAYFQMKSGSFRRKIEDISAGVAQQKVSLGKFRELPLLVPPIDEQTEIVRRVEQLFAFADQLETKVQNAKERIDKLTQSILAKAFRGELVPQDPSDEPASVLLERIKAQRAAEPKAKRGRKKAESA